MSEYSWIFVNKNYLFIAILSAALIVPVGMVTADIVFDNPENADVETDGANDFDGLQGPQGVEIFQNGTDNYALVASFDDDAVTLVNLSNPRDAVNKDILDGSVLGTAAAGTTSEGRLLLEGASSLALFANTTDNVGGNFAIVTSYLGDGFQIIHSNDEKSDTDHAIYPTLNASGQVSPATWDGANYGGDGKGPVLKGLDGAMDVAVFINKTGSGHGDRYAVIVGHVGDAIQLIDISDPEVGGATYYSTGGNFMNATKDGGDGTHAATDYKTQWGAALSGRLPIDGAFGVDIFYDSPAGNMPYAIVTGQVSDGFQIFSLNDTAVGPVPYANRTSSESGFELLESPTGVATWNTSLRNADRWAIIASNWTDSVSVVSLKDPSNTSVLSTLSQQANLALDGALRVEVAKIGDRHYAFVSSNGTTAISGVTDTNTITGGLQVIDLYNPSNIQPVAAIIDGQGLFTSLGAAHDVGVFSLDGHTYAAVVSYDDDGIHIIKITSDKVSSSNRLCGVSIDCSSPTVSSGGGSITVNGNEFATESRFNDVDTVQAKVGQMVTVKANIHDSFGGDEVYKSNLYFDFAGPSPDWSNAAAYIKYDLIRDEVEIVDANGIFDGNVSASVSGDMATVTFKIMFTGPMDTSHMAIQNIDNSRNYQLLYFRDAVEVTGTPTQTSLDDSVDDEVTQTSTATVPGWVKNTAGWWAEGAISETEFVKGVEYLIQQQIIDTDAQTTSSEGTGASVPDWVKNTAGWWADGSISENEFVNAIEHLVKTGTIIVV